jgi:hypothetical protein
MKKIFLLILFLLPVPSLASTISDFSPHVHFTLDEESGVRYDSVGSYNLTDNNTVGFTTGLLDNAADFESSNSEYLNNTSALGLTDDQDFTLSYWYNPESQSSHQLTVYAGDGSTNGFIARAEPAGTLFIQWSDGSGTCKFRTSSSVFSTATWYHVFVVYLVNSDDAKIYIDGALQGKSTISTACAGYHDANDFELSHVGGQYIDGFVDEVTVFPADEQSIVSTIYNSGTPLPYAGQLTSSSSDIVIIPYNKDMPKLTSVSASGTDYIMNYATSTEVYPTPDILFLLFLSCLIFGGVIGYLTYRFI